MRLALEYLDGFCPVTGLQHLEAFARKQTGQKLPYDFFVIDDQDRPLPGTVLWQRVGVGVNCFFNVGNGEIEGEDSPLALFAFHLDKASVGFDRLLHQVKTHAELRPFRLGSKIGLENFCPYGVIDAGARIFYLHRDVHRTSDGGPAGPYRERASLAHRVFRIDAEVEEDVLKLACIAADRRQRLLELFFHLDRPEALPDEEQHVAEQAVEVDHVYRLCALPPREIEKVLGQARRPFRGVLNDLGVPSEMALLGRHFLDQRGVAQYAGQHVVEVMRDAARELADALHPVLINVLFIEGPFVGYVLQNDALEGYRVVIVLYGVTLQVIDTVGVPLPVVQLLPGRRGLSPTGPFQFRAARLRSSRL